MRIKIGLNLSAVALAALAVALPARADRRTLIRAYEYQTQPQGNLEFELWNEIETPKSSFADSLITHKLELEYGLTDRWDVALYHVFQQGGPAASSEPFHFDSWRLETRYRFAEKGVLPVDLMLYFEVERPAKLGDPFAIEQKIILEKSFGPLAVVSNLVAEQRLGTGENWKYELEIDLGLRYELAPAFRIAGEVWGIREKEGAAEAETALYAGPSVSFATKKFWLQVGAGFGLNDDAKRVQFRSVLGLNL